MRIISQRVAPRASAASSCRTGVCRKISRQSAVMIGRIMTASTMRGGEDRAAGAETGAGEEREPAEVVVEPGVDGLHGRGEHADAPEAEDDRGHGGEQVDDVAEALREAARRVVRDEEGDAERERHGHEQREERGPDGAEERAGRRSPRSSSVSERRLVGVGAEGGDATATMRKIATAASVTRIIDAGERAAVPEKTTIAGPLLRLDPRGGGGWSSRSRSSVSGASDGGRGRARPRTDVLDERSGAERGRTT